MRLPNAVYRLRLWGGAASPGCKSHMDHETRIPPDELLPRRDRLKQLQAFCEVVRQGSMTDAATALASSQPAISNLVRALEDELDTRLFRRRGGRLTPNRIGTRLYQTAIPLVEGLLRLPVLFDEHHTGVAGRSLEIGVGQFSAIHVLPDILQRYVARFPDTRIELRSGPGRQRLAWLRAFDLDVVVAAFDIVPPDIEFHRLAEASPVVITPKDHPLRRRKRVYIEELAGQPLVVPPNGSHIRDIIDTVLRLHGVRPAIALEVGGWSTIINHVAAGVGVAFLPELCIGDQDPVCKVHLVHSYRFRSYGLAVRRGSPIGLAEQRFLELAVDAAGSGDIAR